MSGSYDDRDGKIWMNGKLVEWRDANVHILTHAMHYASSVFEGERAYGGKIFKSLLHSERLLKSAKMVDFEIPYSVEEIENAKYGALNANGEYYTDAGFQFNGEDIVYIQIEDTENFNETTVVVSEAVAVSEEVYVVDVIEAVPVTLPDTIYVEETTVSVATRTKLAE